MTIARETLALLIASLCLAAVFAESSNVLRAKRSSSSEVDDQNNYIAKVKKWYDWNDSNLQVDKKWYDWQTIPSSDKRHQKRQFGNVLRNSRFEWNFLRH
uniref:RxLR effector protein n=1 Tax=Steinernema glaseri TaxID=37863 RepID=A0A1I7ZTY8_9BILA